MGALQAQARSLQRIAILLEHSSRHAEEVETYKKLIDVYRHLDLERNALLSTISLGVAQFNAKQLDEAAKTLQDALTIAEAHDDIEVQIDIVGNLGLVRSAQKRLPEAIKLHLKEVELSHRFPAKEDSDSADPKAVQLQAHTRLGTAFLEDNQFELAMMEFNKRLQLAIDINDADQQKLALSAMKFVSDEQAKYKAKSEFSQVK